MFFKKYWWLIIASIAHFAASFIFPFVYWPEMLNWPYLMTLGWLPYRDFTTIVTPVLPILLGLNYKVFGLNTTSMHIFGALLLSVLNLLIAWFVIKNTGKIFLAILSAILFIFLSLAFEGNHVWYDSLLSLFLIGVFWFQHSYLRKNDNRKIFISGLFFGLALLTKQTAFYAVLAISFFFAYLFFGRKYNLSKLFKLVVWFLMPVFILGLFFAGVLSYLGIVGDFWNWGIKFVLTKQNTLLPHPAQLLFIVGIFMIAVYLVKKAKKIEVTLPFVWMFSTSLLLWPRFAYFHFIPALAFFIITFALATNTFKKKQSVFALFGLIILVSFPLFVKTYRIGQRFLTTQNIEIAKWLTINYPSSTVFSLNGPDIIYFLSGKTPGARPYVDQLPWQMEFAGQTFTDAFINNPPDIVVTSPYLERPVDGLGAYQPVDIIKFVSGNYHVVKVFPQDVTILGKNK